MKKVKLISALLFTAIFVVIACKKQEINTPLDTDGTPPKPVSNVVVTNLSGAAQITYTLPDDANLLYVKAVWESKGTVKEAKSSLYKNTILLEGFGDTNQYEVSLYAVSRSEVLSTAVKVMVKPLPPPIAGVYSSLVASAAFGGINLQFNNPTQANIIVGILVKDSLGFWQHVDFNYTSQVTGNYTVRGYPPVERTWGIYVKDRWDNHTDTLVTKLTPIYEEQLDKTKFLDARGKFPIPQIAPLPASGLPMKEAVDYSSSYPITKLWDGNSTSSSMFHTKQNVDQPLWIPFDLDQSGASKFKLSRFKIWQRTGSFTFNHGNPHKWEIWGTNTPAVVGSWVKLGTWVMTKPSGLPVGINSNEDVQVATDGQDFDFPAGIPSVRYIAWKNIDSWASIDGASGFFHLYELTLWGQKQ